MSGEQNAACCCGEFTGPTGCYTVGLCAEVNCQAPCPPNAECDPCTLDPIACFIDDVTLRNLYDLPPPGGFDPNKCYLFKVGTCIRPLSFFLPCLSAPFCPTIAPPAGTIYLGAFDLVDGQCPCVDPSWSELYTVGPDQWSGGISCGTTATVNFAWDGLYCNGACNTSTDQCVKPVETLVGYFRLDGFPALINSLTSLCDQQQRECASCISAGSGGSFQTYEAHDQIAGNQCADGYPDNPCSDPLIGGGRACSATVTMDLLLQGPPTVDYSVAFTITRSCPHPNQPYGWTDLDIDPFTGQFRFRVDGCYLYVNTCARTTSIVEKLKTLLQTDPDDECRPKFALRGKYGYLGPACVNGDCVGQINPYLWYGPVYSPDGLTATYYCGPQWEYTADIQASVGNFTFYDPDDQRCECTGSQSGGASGQWQANASPLLELDVPLTFASLGTWSEVFASNACVTPPTVT